jgi:hypothetical protein
MVKDYLMACRILCKLCLVAMLVAIVFSVFNFQVYSVGAQGQGAQGHLTYGVTTQPGRYEWDYAIVNTGDVPIKDFTIYLPHYGGYETPPYVSASDCPPGWTSSGPDDGPVTKPGGYNPVKGGQTLDGFKWASDDGNGAEAEYTLSFADGTTSGKQTGIYAPRHASSYIFAYTSSPSVGGIWVPVDKFGLLAPYIGLASTILVATVATSIYAKRVNRKKEKQ